MTHRHFHAFRIRAIKSISLPNFFLALKFFGTCITRKCLGKSSPIFILTILENLVNIIFFVSLVLSTLWHGEIKLHFYIDRYQRFINSTTVLSDSFIGTKLLFFYFFFDFMI